MLSGMLAVLLKQGFAVQYALESHTHYFMSDQDDEDDIIAVDIASHIPQAPLFHRDQPAYLEGPLRNWELAQTVVDFGAALLVQWKDIRASDQLKDVVLQALLRRRLVSTEAYVTLLSRGLIEPALGLSRTLLDNELALRLVLVDATGRMAKRLAAYHYLTYQEHGQDMLHDRETREGILTSGGRVPEVAQVSGSYKRFLDLPIFDDVREDVRKARFWHGYANAEQAFRAADAPSDYFMLYDAATWFVHDVNVDFDYADRSDTEMRLKPLVERDPKAIQTPLGHELLRLATVLRLLVDDRGYPEGPPFDVMSTVTFPDGRIEEVNALEALTGQLVSIFGIAGQ